MPTPPKRLENTTKHWTNREREARLRAEIGVQRGTRVQIRAPKWLSSEARKIFEATKKKIKSLELLDNVDADLLAVYCDAQVHYQEMTRQIHAAENGQPIDDEIIKQAQSWARLISAYAEKLGLTPNARARLAKKRAEKRPLDEFEQLLEEANDTDNWREA